MSWTLCSSGAAIAKAGIGANAAIVMSGHGLIRYSDEAESEFCIRTRKDWLANPPLAHVSGAITKAVAAMIATDIISYDMGGYTSRLEAQTMLDKLDDEKETIIRQLAEKENQEFRE
tara:strand:+ start:314 stop:664 length:351 start_codon:yes stop_codon:yes gene_type:complete